MKDWTKDKGYKKLEEAAKRELEMVMAKGYTEEEAHTMLMNGVARIGENGEIIIEEL